MKPPDRVLALGLDLGSTRIKAGVLDREGRLGGVEAVAAPALGGAGAIREGDAWAYADAAYTLVRSVARRVPRGTPLGIASQRSSFTIWSRASGRPVTPLVSWQDRRAAAWCAAHRALEPEVVQRTGLPLSAHYVGPKLAAMQRADPDLAGQLRSGQHLFGTLETFVAWRASGRSAHETDLSVAARTLLVDLRTANWSDELLAHFEVPPGILPAIVPTAGRSVDCDLGLVLAATVADQAAAALAVLAETERSVLVNLGTGAFVLRLTDSPDRRQAGYLTAPIFGGPARARFTMEGTINGAGPALDRFAPGPTPLPDADPSGDAFAIPDLAGLGSPYWRPSIGLTLSPAAQALDGAGRRRAVLEGLLFRVAEIMDDLSGDEAPARVLLAGGAARETAVAQGLATLLGRPVEVLDDQESGLIGAARLAAGLQPYTPTPARRVDPGAGGYLPAKFGRWRDWLDTLLSG